MKCGPIEIAGEIYGRIDSGKFLELEPRKSSSRTREIKFVAGEIGNAVSCLLYTVNYLEAFLISSSS